MATEKRAEFDKAMADYIKRKVCCTISFLDANLYFILESNVFII